MASLDRAVPSTEDCDPASVTEHLRLDVPGALEVALEEDRVVTERPFGLTASRCKGFVQLCRRADNTHAAAATACRGLDDERVADLVGRPLRQSRHAALDRDPVGSELVATEPERLGRGADPGHAGSDHRFGKRRVFGQEAVARMDCVGSGGDRGANMLGRVEIRADLGCPVGRPRVE